jgi:hypothetical protein
MPGGILLFDIKVFENYKKEFPEPEVEKFFDKFKLYFQSKDEVKFKEKL